MLSLLRIPWISRGWTPAEVHRGQGLGGGQGTVLVGSAPQKVSQS